MEFMTVKQAAEKWGLSERRLQTICNEGMIPGVVKFGRAWAIPMDAEMFLWYLTPVFRWKSQDYGSSPGNKYI